MVNWINQSNLNSNGSIDWTIDPRDLNLASKNGGKKTHSFQYLTAFQGRATARSAVEPKAAKPLES